MVRHDFRCHGCGNVFEKAVASNFKSSPRCPECKGKTDLIYLPRRQDAQHFSPVVIFRGPNGKVRFPGDSDAPTPKGYKREELRTSYAVHKFEREMNQREISRYQNRQEREERCYEPFHAAMRSQLRAHARHFSPLGRDFAETAMRENNNRTRRSYDPGFHIEAFHNHVGKDDR